jgi:hypothetical protein
MVAILTLNFCSKFLICARLSLLSLLGKKPLDFFKFIDKKSFRCNFQLSFNRNFSFQHIFRRFCKDIFYRKSQKLQLFENHLNSFEILHKLVTGI